MLIGPIYHVSHVYHSSNLLIKDSNDFIYDLFSFTHPFRMEAFFLLAGFFSTLLIEKKGIKYFKKSRIEKIFIPLIFSTLLILPITNYIIYKYSGDYVFSFWHLWFLITLSIILSFYYLFYEKLKFIILKISNLSVIKIMLFALVYYGLLYYSNIIVYKVMISHDLVYTNIFFQNIIFNPLINVLPVLLGSSLYYKRKFIPKKYNYIIIIFFILFHTIFTSPALLEFDFVLKLVLRCLYFIIVSSLILMIFNFFVDLNISNNKTISFFVNSSFTIYLVHQPLVFLNCLLVNNYFSDFYLQFVFASTLTYVESIFLYILFSRTYVGRLIFGIKEPYKPELSMFKSINYTNNS